MQPERPQKQGGWSSSAPVRQGQGVVAPFAGDGVAAFVDLAAERQTAAAAGAEDGGEDDGGSGGGAVMGFGRGEAVGVVGAADGAVEGGFQVVAEGLAGHPDRVGAFDQAGGRADRAGHSDADGALAAGVALYRADDSGYGFDRGGIVAARGRHAQAGRDLVG